MKMYCKHLLFVWISISSAFANECRTNKDCGPTETCEVYTYEICETGPASEDICATEVGLRCMPVPIFCEGDYTCEAPHLSCYERRGRYGRLARRPDADGMDSDAEEWVLPCDGEPGCTETSYECRYDFPSCNFDHECDENFECVGILTIEEVCDGEPTCPEAEELDDDLWVGVCLPKKISCAHTHTVCPEYWSCQVVAALPAETDIESESNPDDIICEPTSLTMCIPEALYPYGFLPREDFESEECTEAGAEARPEVGDEAGDEADSEAGTESTINMGAQENTDINVPSSEDIETRDQSQNETDAEGVNQGLGGESNATQRDQGCDSTIENHKNIFFCFLIGLALYRRRRRPEQRS